MRLEQSEVVFSCILYTLYIMDFAKQTLPSAFSALSGCGRANISSMWTSPVLFSVMSLCLKQEQQ